MVALVIGNTRAHDDRSDVYVKPNLSTGKNRAISSSAPVLECQPTGTASDVNVLTPSLASPAAPCSPANSREMCQGDSSTRVRRAASQMKQPDGTTGAVTPAAEKPPRALKRALKGALGVSLVAAAAALLVGADDVGEWLHSVAPNVMPHAEAGAEIVQRAIAEAKKCIHEGANVCLDAEGQVTALCESYSHSTRAVVCSNMIQSRTWYGTSLLVVVLFCVAVAAPRYCRCCSSLLSLFLVVVVVVVVVFRIKCCFCCCTSEALQGWRFSGLVSQALPSLRVYHTTHVFLFRRLVFIIAVKGLLYTATW